MIGPSDFCKNLYSDMINRESFYSFGLRETAFSVECSAGTYRDNTVTTCTKCAENSITEQTGAASCTSCSAGTVSNEERTQCGNLT